MKNSFRFRHIALAIGTLTLVGLAQAGVISGTGRSVIIPVPSPSSTQLAETDAVRMTMSESGPGHILIAPYFSVQAGQVTTIQLINSDLLNGKAVKLSFLGATNGDALMSFQLLMAPGDVWTGTLTQGSDGKAQLASKDRSCTLPRFPANAAVPFSTNRLNPKLPAAVQASQTREGFVHAIVMADIPSMSIYGPARNEISRLFRAVRHVNGAAPCISSTLEAALLNDINSEAVAAGLGFSTPTSGLSGNWSIIDPVQGLTHSGTATAFTAVTKNGSKARGNFVYFPQTDTPVSGIEKLTSDPLLIPAANGGPASIQASLYDLPDLSTPYYLPASAVNSRRTKSELTALLSAMGVSNQFVSDSRQSKKTDWVLTAPTRRYYTGYDYAKSNSPNAMIRPPVVGDFLGEDYFGMAVASTDTVCNVKPFSAYRNREAGDGLNGDTTGRLRTSICGATTVLSFNGPNAVSALSSSLNVQKPSLPFLGEGWASVYTGNLLIGPGLPLLGVSVTRVQPTPASSVGRGEAGSAMTLSHSFDR